jgi:hypothetical protein
MGVSTRVRSSATGTQRRLYLSRIAAPWSAAESFPCAFDLQGRTHVVTPIIDMIINK